MGPISTVPLSPTAITNGARFELITELMEQPLKIGDAWYLIPQQWFDDWKNVCEDYPDLIGTTVGAVNTSTLTSFVGDLNYVQNMAIPASA